METILLHLAHAVRHWPVRSLHFAFALLLLVAQSVSIFSEEGIALSGSYDVMVKHRLWAPKPDPDIVVVDIDEASLARMAGDYGRWPWPRDTLAATVEYLERQGAVGVVFDILFSDADKLNPAADAAFSQAIAASQRTWFPVLRLNPNNDGKSQLKLADLPGFAVPLGTPNADATVAAVPPLFASAVNTQRLGYHNVSPDPDSVIRHYHYFEDLQGWRMQAMPMSIARAQHWPLPIDDKVLIRWPSAQHARISFADVFEDSQLRQPLLNPSTWKNKWVFIGSTAPSLHDVKASPLSHIHPGIDIYATALDNVKNQAFLSEVPRWFLFGLTVLLMLGMLWLTARFSHEQLAFAFLLLPSALLLLSFASLHVGHYYLDLLPAAQITFTFLTAVKIHGQLLRWAHTQTSSPNHATAPHLLCFMRVDVIRLGAAMEWPMFEAFRDHQGVLITDPRPNNHFLAENPKRCWMWYCTVTDASQWTQVQNNLDRKLENLRVQFGEALETTVEVLDSQHEPVHPDARYWHHMAQN